MISATTYLSAFGFFNIYMTIYFWRVNLSGVTLFVKPEKEELLSMTGDKRLISLGVLNLGVPGVFGVPDVVALGVTVKVSLLGYQ